MVSADIERLRKRKSSKWSFHKEDVIGCHPAEMDFRTADVVQEAILALARDERYGYHLRGAGGPAEALRTAFANRVDTLFDWSIDPGDCLITADVTQAVAASVVAFSEQGTPVATFTPCYPAFRRVANDLRRPFLELPLFSKPATYAVDDSTYYPLKSVIRGIAIVCNPHNPTGRVFRREELLPLLKWADANGVTVVSDEIHADLVYAPHEHVPLAKIFPEYSRNIVTLYSASKSFNIPGLGCAIVHFGSAAQREKFSEENPASLLGTPPTIGHVATLAAWENGGRWLRETLDLLATNREYLHKWLSEHDLADAHKPQATYLYWVDFGAVGIARPYTHFLQNARVALGDGVLFGGQFASFARMNFATTPEILEETCKRLASAL